MKLELSSLFKTVYDDGGGNTCVYFFDLFPASTVTFPESSWYRPKAFRVLSPASAVTLTSSSRASVVGAPPATTTMVVATTGKLTLAANSTLDLAYGQIKITEIVQDMQLYEGEQRAYCLAVPSSGVRLQDGVVDEYLAYAADDLTHEAILNATEVNDFFRFQFGTEGTIDISTFLVTDVTFLVGAARLFDADFTLGKSIEQAVTLLMVSTGIKNKSYGALIGSVSEYLKDGTIGDLDLPLEVFQNMVKA